MKFENLKIPGLVKITPRQFRDDRGFFMETFRSNLFCEAIGQDISFVQDNHSSSSHKGTIRGLHFQTPPHAQGKLVRCSKGALIDVAVDARRGSPTFGQHIALELTAENGVQLWIPAGFLHGFMTLENNTDIAYKCTDYYSHPHDGAVQWDDPDLNIDWGIEKDKAHISAKDNKAQSFASFKSPFIFEK